MDRRRALSARPATSEGMINYARSSSKALSHDIQRVFPTDVPEPLLFGSAPRRSARRTFPPLATMSVK